MAYIQSGSGANVIITQSGTDVNLNDLRDGIIANSVTTVDYDDTDNFETFTFDANTRLVLNGTSTINPNTTQLIFERRVGASLNPASAPPNITVSAGATSTINSLNSPINTIPGNVDETRLQSDYRNQAIVMVRTSNQVANTPPSSLGSVTEGDIAIAGTIDWRGFNIRMGGSIQTTSTAAGTWVDSNVYIPDQSTAFANRGMIQQLFHGTGLTLTNVAFNPGEFIQGRTTQFEGLNRAGGIAAVTMNGRAGQVDSRDANNNATVVDFNGYVFDANTALPRFNQVNWRHGTRVPLVVTEGSSNSTGRRRYYYTLSNELFIRAQTTAGAAISGVRYFIRDVNHNNRKPADYNSIDDTADKVYRIITGTNLGDLQLTEVNGTAVTQLYSGDDRVDVTLAIANADPTEEVIPRNTPTTTVRPANATAAQIANTIDIRVKNADPAANDVGWLLDIPAWHYLYQPQSNADFNMVGVGGRTLTNTFQLDPDITLSLVDAAALTTRVTLSGTDVGVNSVRNIQINNDMTLDEFYDLLKILKVNESTYFEFPTPATSIATNGGSGYLNLSNINITQTTGGNLTRGTKFTGLRLTTANTFFNAANHAIDFDIDAVVQNPRVFLNNQIPDPADRATNFSFSGTVDGTLEVDYPSDSNSTNNIVFNGFMSTGLTVTSDDTDPGDVVLAGNAFGDLIGNAAITIDPAESSQISLEQIPAGTSQVVIDLSETTLGDHIHVFRIVNNTYQVITDILSSGTSTLTYNNTTYSDIETNPIRILWNNRGTRTNYQALSGPTIVAGETLTNTFSLSALSPLPTNPPVTPTGGFANPASITFQPSLRTGVSQQVLQVLDTNAGAVTEKIHPEITATIADRRAAVGDATNNYLAGLARLISAGTAGTPSPTDGGAALTYDTVLPGSTGADMINAVMFFQQGLGTAIGNIEVLDSVVLTNNNQNFNVDNLDSVQQRIPLNIQLSTEATEQVRFGKRATAATVDDVTSVVDSQTAQHEAAWNELGGGTLRPDAGTRNFG